jgi:hypothetical protein
LPDTQQQPARRIVVNTFKVDYNLTFSNSVNVKAKSHAEAEKKFWQLDRAEVFYSLGGVENGCEIALITAVKS